MLTLRVIYIDAGFFVFLIMQIRSHGCNVQIFFCCHIFCVYASSKAGVLWCNKTRVAFERDSECILHIRLFLYRYFFDLYWLKYFVYIVGHSYVLNSNTFPTLKLPISPPV